MYSRSTAGPRLRERARLLDRLEGLLRARIVDVEVVVGAERPRDAPVRHRSAGSSSAARWNDRNGLFVIEREDQRKPTIEVPLGLGIRSSRSDAGDRQARPWDRPDAAAAGAGFCCDSGAETLHAAARTDRSQQDAFHSCLEP